MDVFVKIIGVSFEKNTNNDTMIEPFFGIRRGRET
jgi:hypothetical protein